MQTVVTIASTILLSNEASVTFSSIPQQYTDLQLIAECAVPSTGYNIVLRFNGDGGNNYSYHYMLGNGSAMSASRNSNISSAYVGIATATNRALNLIDIYGYSSTNRIKTMVSSAGQAGWGSSTWVSIWNSTNAISSIVILPETGNFSSGSKFTLRGIA